MPITAESLAAGAETVLADLRRRMPNAADHQAEVMNVLAPYVALAASAGAMVCDGEAAEAMQAVLVKSIAGMKLLLQHLDNQALAGSIAVGVLELAELTACEALDVLPAQGTA